MTRCSCLAAVTDIPCKCEPAKPYDGWLERVLEKNRHMLARLPHAMRASPDRAETVKQGSVGEADSTRSGEAGGAQDSTRVRIGDGQ